MIFSNYLSVNRKDVRLEPESCMCNGCYVDAYKNAGEPGFNLLQVLPAIYDQPALTLDDSKGYHAKMRKQSNRLYTWIKNETVNRLGNIKLIYMTIS